MEDGPARLVGHAAGPRAGGGLRRARRAARWLGKTLGPTEFATTPLRSLLADGLEIHFRDLEDAAVFRDAYPDLVLADDTMSPVYSSPYLPSGREDPQVCNLYSQTRSQDAMRQLFADVNVVDRLGNLPPLPTIHPDQSAPIVRRRADGAGVPPRALGPADAAAVRSGQVDRPRRDERPQRRLAALAALARAREPLPATISVWTYR